MEKKIVVQKNKVIEFSDERSKKLVENAIKKNEKFFGNLVCDFSVTFLKTRKEYDKVHGSPTKEWSVGGMYGTGKIYLFDEDVFDKVSCYPKESFYEILTHEIAHVFVQENFDWTLPAWLNEGIACAAAEQDKTTREPLFDLREAYTEEEWNKDYPYGTSGKYVRHLIDNYGKEKIIELMKSLIKDETKENFKIKFKKIYNIDLDNDFGNWMNKQKRKNNK